MGIGFASSRVAAAREDRSCGGATDRGTVAVAFAIASAVAHDFGVGNADGRKNRDRKTIPLRLRIVDRLMPSQDYYTILP